MTINNAEIQDLTPQARADVGRAQNALIRMKNAEHEVATARQEYMNYLIKLRGGHGLTIRKIGAILNKTNDHIMRYTSAYVDPDYSTGRRVRVIDAPKKKRPASGRPKRHLAGGRAVPGEEPSVSRTLRRLREEIGD